jgi:hypothetical protein
MARAPRSRASRAERRVLKERIQSAQKHGLPVPPPPQARQRATDPARASVLSAAADAARVPRQRMPLFVKLLGLGLGLLAAVYALTLLRDHGAKAGAERPKSAPAAEFSK